MTSLYQQLLGAEFDRLPAPIRALHTVGPNSHFAGRCHSERGRHIVARLIAMLLRLPPSQIDQALRVSFQAAGDTEIWTRHFGRHRFVSTQWLHHGLMHERIKCVTLVFAVTGDPDGLRLHLRDIKFCGLPIQWLVRARITADETVKDGRFHLAIATHLPWIGLLVRYAGWLMPANTQV